MSSVTAKSNSLTTVHRAFAILDHLWELDGVGPTELAERMDLPESTVYDYLRSMSETKYVTRQNGQYYPSRYFLTLSGKMKHRNRLFQVAKSEMKRVAAETDALVGLTVENEGRALIFHQEEGRRALSLGTYPGAVTPLHTTAAGKAILAHLPEEKVEEVIAEVGLEPRTEHTITDPAELKSELEKIRQEGYAIDWDQQVMGMGMVGLPILVEGEILGSFSIVAPSKRIQKESRQRELLQKVQEMENTVTVNYKYGK